jgi:hypothetical protein
MRILKFSCGVAVLFTSLAYAHLLHRYIIGATQDHPISWAMMVPAMCTGILSFVGAFLLLKTSR